MAHEVGQLDMFGGEIKPDTEYKQFTEKFEPKKTTDDCYTPPLVYEAVAGWVAREYGVQRDRFLRPFWPGGDYKRENVPEGSVVVDNPPFSIIAQIVRHYLRTGARFFLFAPTLTLFSGHERRACYIPCGVSITYENGAQVNTSFVTNLDPHQLRTAPELYQAVKLANDENRRKDVKELPKYTYPDNVLTAAAAYQYSRLGVDFRVMPQDCAFIRALDAQRQVGKAIFGSALLLSEQSAAERAAADREASRRAAIERDAQERDNAKMWELSEREKAICAGFGGGGVRHAAQGLLDLIMDGDGHGQDHGAGAV